MLGCVWGDFGWFKPSIGQLLCRGWVSPGLVGLRQEIYLILRLICHEIFRNLFSLFMLTIYCSPTSAAWPCFSSWRFFLSQLVPFLPVATRLANHISPLLVGIFVPLVQSVSSILIGGSIILGFLNINISQMVTRINLPDGLACFTPWTHVAVKKL